MKPLVVIVGETASGKSSLAMKLAERFDGEIVCADAWTVYGGFDIGTAKPSKKDREAVVHHMLDVADPAEGYSAAMYKEAAEGAIADIHARGTLPILVGGTGLYIDSILYDYGFLNQADSSEREELKGMSLEQLLGHAHELELDLSSIDIQNKRRVIRHIENRGVRPTRGKLREATLIVGLRSERESLAARIETRTDAMLGAGLEQEVRNLSGRYGWGIEPMKGIGYREWRGYFAGSQTLDETRQEIIQNSLQLAKKQRTWFRRNNSIHWVNHPSNAVEIVTTFLNK